MFNGQVMGGTRKALQSCRRQTHFALVDMLRVGSIGKVAYAMITPRGAALRRRHHKRVRHR